MKYKMLRSKILHRIILVAVTLYMVSAFDVLGKVKALAQHTIYTYSDKIISKHYDRYVSVNNKKSVEDRIIDGINRQLYGINYIIEQGEREMLVEKDDGNLFNYMDGDNDNQTGESDKNGEETIEVSALLPPADSVVFSKEQLADFNFLVSKLYTIPARAKVLESDLVANDMLNIDMSIKGGNEKPQILVYHTHSQEAFADSVDGEGMTIVQVGEYLTKLLEEKGFNVIHCKESFDLDKNGNLDRSNAYVNALPVITQILEDNPSIEVVLDIHRDGLPDGVDKLVTNINGKQVAKIMFFNGVSRSSATGEIDYLYNQYRGNNLALSFQAKLKAMEYYPDFTRKNYIDAYQYNQHVIDRAMLIEVGAQNNDFKEAFYAMEPLSDILYLVLGKKD